MNKKGFTLVEVLVSLALVSTIAIFLFQIIFIIRDIYAEKNIKSEIYIESSNISNVINKDIYNKDKDGIYIKNINKVSNDELYITYSDGTKNNIVIDRSNNTITYGNYTVSILDVAKIGNIELYYNYETTETNKNGICYIKIPITHDDYKNDFGIVITYRYDSSKTKINGEVSTRPGRTGYDCNVLAGTTWTFDYTGDVQTFSVPCNGTYKLETWGAQGGTYSSDLFGGYGGYSTGSINLYSNQHLYVVVGQGGQSCNGASCQVAASYNGGANCKAYSGGSMCGSGGGATHIATSSGVLSTLENNKNSIIMVAGGGGASAFTNSSNNGSGGHAGGYIGSDATNPQNSRDFVANGYGGGGSQTAAGRRIDSSGTVDACIGGFGQGGTCLDVNLYGSGAGGGGYYGGGGSRNSSGGGGSSYIANALLTNKKMVCYNCATSNDDSTKTESNTCVNTDPVADCSKQGNGYAKITLVSYN